jgi:5'-nucleotidase/UDP-sugar diphosphatase
MKFILLLTIFLMSAPALSKKIQIIHTNDLHTYLTGYTPLQGGYYRIKTLIDELKQSAKEQGIESLVLDGGDFGEGSHYFLLDDGIHSFRALDMLGIDATVIGNHDYMFGGPHLGNQIRLVNSKTKFLGANIAKTPEMRLGDVLQPSARFTIDGVNIEVVGLTTNSLHFLYAIRPGLILPPEGVSRAYTKKAREENGADLVVALTHLGVYKDIQLVKKDPNIDVVIGGHSHTRLDEALMEENSEGRVIPIVQTGANAMTVGSLILDVKGPKDIQVISYKVHDADMTVSPDKDVLDYVLEVDQRTRDVLGEGRWDEVLGRSEFDLTGYTETGKHDHQEGCWTRHLPRILKEETDADIGMYLGIFAGKNIPKGEITYGDIIENFPHVNEFGQKGWEIMTFELKGWKLYSLLTAIINLSIGDSVLIGGVDYRTYQFPSKLPYIGGRKFFTRLRINGRRLRFKSMYKLALPYELSRMLDGVLPSRVRKYIPLDFKRGEYFLWPMAENYIRKRQVLRCR